MYVRMYEIRDVVLYQYVCMKIKKLYVIKFIYRYSAKLFLLSQVRLRGIKTMLVC